MKTQIIFLFTMGIIASALCSPLSYDNQPPVTNEEVRMLKPRLDCVLDKGPCDDLGNLAKQRLPEVIKTRKCSSCDAETSRRIDRIFQIMHFAYLPELKEIYQKYGGNTGTVHVGNH